MARKPKSSGGSPEQQDQQFFAALFDLAAERPWSRVTVSDAAARAGLPVGETLARFGGTAEALRAFSRHADARMLAGLGPLGEGESVRDRLFDVIMRRFDALNPHRAGLTALLRGGAFGDPDAMVAGLFGFRRAAILILEAADQPTAGLSGLVRRGALSAMLLWCTRAWLRDESQDLTKTMAAVDQAVGRLIPFLRGLPAGPEQAERDDADKELEQ